jgi:ATP/maltotriose-dependent transcriptional regulator MalT
VLEAKEKDQYFIMASAYSALMRRSLFFGDTEDAAAQLDHIRENGHSRGTDHDRQQADRALCSARC